MKKLNLLKPGFKSMFLERGEGEEVKYLEIPEILGYDQLKDDIDIGAKQFAELLDEDDKKQRLVVIQSNTKEEGFMAVTYLAGLYNETHPEGDEDYEDDEDYDDYEDYDGYDITDDFEDEQDMNLECWVESRYKLPVIDYYSVGSYESEMNTYSSGPFAFGGIPQRHNRKPYWTKLRNNAVCILKDTSGFSPYQFNETIKHAVARFKTNPRIYLLIIKRNEYNGFTIDDCESERELCELMLDYTLTPKVIKCDAQDLEQYYKVVFENWVEAYGMKLQKNFPRESIVSRIMKINVMDKSELIEKVVKYVIAKNPNVTAFSKSNFDVLDVFKALGLEKLHVDKPESTKSLDEKLVGMEEVKNKLRGIVEIMKYNRRRKDYGLGGSSFQNIHLFIGAPGTAKTTAAQLLGNIMCEEHLLPGNRFIAINGAELKGMYVGHTAPKVKALFEKYDVILIDEAYSICSASSGDMDSFGEEGIAQLILEMEAHGNDKLIMFSGYGGEDMKGIDNRMKQFLDVNPGIRSRINSTIYFKSYNASEMVDIFMSIAKNRNYKVDKEATDIVYKHFEKRCKCKDFGNGREARRLVESAMLQAAMRLKDLDENKLSKSKLSQLTAQDVGKAVEGLEDGYLNQNESNICRFGFV